MSKNPAFQAAKQMIPLDSGKLEKMFSIRITERLYQGIEQMSDEGRKAMVCEARKLFAKHVHMSRFDENEYL